MSWRQVNVMTERWQFVRDARQRLVTFTELCALYGISRVTGYKDHNIYGVSRGDTIQ